MAGNSGQDLTVQSDVATVDDGWRPVALGMLLFGTLLLAVGVVGGTTIDWWVEEFDISWRTAITLTAHGGWLGFWLTAFGLLILLDNSRDRRPDPLQAVREELEEFRREVAELRSRMEGGG